MIRVAKCPLSRSRLNRLCVSGATQTVSVCLVDYGQTIWLWFCWRHQSSLQLRGKQLGRQRFHIWDHGPQSRVELLPQLKEFVCWGSCSWGRVQQRDGYKADKCNVSRLVKGWLPKQIDKYAKKRKLDSIFSCRPPFCALSFHQGNLKKWLCLIFMPSFSGKWGIRLSLRVALQLLSLSPSQNIQRYIVSGAAFPWYPPPWAWNPKQCRIQSTHRIIGFVNSNEA